MPDWLLEPLSGAREHYISPWFAWHGRLMVFSWTILLPLGILIARYCKITSSQAWPRELDNKFWWHSHLTLQYSGMAIALLGFWLAFTHAHAASTIGATHGFLGYIVMGLGIAQVLTGLLRGTKGGPTGKSIDWRGDHYDMTSRRRLFEYLHKYGGFLAVMLAAGVTILGLIAADAPLWMLIVILTWWALLLAVSVFLQRHGRCIDTYQAIWGPDLVHPGNALRPIGLGVRRLASLADATEKMGDKREH